MSDKPIHAESVPDPRLSDLVTLILRMAHQLKEHYPESDLPSKAVGYLQRKGVMPDVESSVLRNAIENAKRAILPEPVEVREFWRVRYEVQRTTVTEVFWTAAESESVATKKEALKKLAEIRRIFGRGCVRNVRLRKIRETLLSQEEVEP